MDELFAEAVERLKAGEPTASIVTFYPADVQAELSEMLAIVEMADQMAVQPLPQRSVRKRSRARAQLLRQAGALRTEMEQTLGAPALEPGGSRMNPKTRSHQPSWWERLAMGWGNLFDRSLLRLAPLAAVTAAVYLAAFWTVRTAEAALPGDVVYPIKQWVREQKVNLAPLEQRPEVIIEVQEELKREVETLATVLDTQPEARARLSLESSEAMVYYGRQGNLLLIGPFLVAPNYQPDAAKEDFVPMVLNGPLQPGATVQLTYRVLPGNTGVVQGVRADVIDEPKPAPEPTATLTPSSYCQVALPPNWNPYPVGLNDTLEDLAVRSSASEASIQAVNCLPDRSLAGVSMLLLPDTIYVRVTPLSLPPPTATLLPTLTPVPTATAIPQPTVTPRPPTVVPIVNPGDLPTDQPTDEPTVEPTDEPSVQPTAALTDQPGLTPVKTPTGTPVQTPAATPIGSPTVLPTESPTAPSTVSPAESPTVSATSEPSITTAPPDQATARPASTLVSTPFSTPVEASTVAATQPAEVPTSSPTAVPTAVLPTQEPTAVPTQAPPTQVPPTQAPPTEALPAPVVPTAVPPTPIPPAAEPPTPEPASLPAAPTSEPATPEPG